ncbi:MAG: trigger factor [Nitrospirota bacterium]|jgi:trigger factor
MLKTVEDISATKKRLRIEIPSEAIESEMQSGLRGLQKRAKIPGFRPGKAPLSIIEKRFGKEVEGDVMEKLLPEYYSSALKEANLSPVARPVFEAEPRLRRNSPLEMTLTVEIRPEIKDLKYEGVKVKDIPVEVEDEEVEESLDRLREKRAVYEPSEEGAAHGDLVVLDYETSGEGEEGNEYKDQTYKVGHGVMPEEFAKEVEGMKKGGSKEFKVTFPEDFPSPEAAGREVGFKVSVKEVKKPVLPEIDDELAKDVGFDDLGALKKHVAEQIRGQKEDTVRKMQKAEAVSKIIADHPFDAPESMVEAELERLVMEAKQSGRKEPEEALAAELRPSAENHVKASILLDTIGEKEGVKVTDEEAKGRLEEQAARIGMTPENIMKYYISRDGSLEGLKHELFEDKVLGLLLERADISKGEKE